MVYYMPIIPEMRGHREIGNQHHPDYMANFRLSHATWLKSKMYLRIVVLQRCVLGVYKPSQYLRVYTQEAC